MGKTSIDDQRLAVADLAERLGRSAPRPLPVDYRSKKLPRLTLPPEFAGESRHTWLYRDPLILGQPVTQDPERFDIKPMKAKSDEAIADTLLWFNKLDTAILDLFHEVAGIDEHVANAIIGDTGRADLLQAITRLSNLREAVRPIATHFCAALLPQILATVLSSRLHELGKSPG